MYQQRFGGKVHPVEQVYPVGPLAGIEGPGQGGRELGGRLAGAGIEAGPEPDSVLGALVGLFLISTFRHDRRS